MEEYANHYTPDGRWPKLADAARLEGVKAGGARHRPLTDTRLTLGIMRAVVERERSECLLGVAASPPEATPPHADRRSRIEREG